MSRSCDILNQVSSSQKTRCFVCLGTTYRSILPYLSSIYLVLCLAAGLWNPQCFDLNSSLHLPPFQACQMILKKLAIAVDRKQASKMFNKASRQLVIGGIFQYVGIPNAIGTLCASLGLVAGFRSWNISPPIRKILHFKEKFNDPQEWEVPFPCSHATPRSMGMVWEVMGRD